MRFIKIAALLLISFLIGCSATVPVDRIGDDYISCVHKYENDLAFTYRSDMMTRTQINNIVTFYFHTVDGKNLYLNIHEIENYNCVQ